MLKVASTGSSCILILFLVALPHFIRFLVTQKLRSLDSKYPGLAFRAEGFPSLYGGILSDVDLAIDIRIELVHPFRLVIKPRRQQ
jgi:hypothetical protein